MAEENKTQAQPEYKLPDGFKDVNEVIAKVQDYESRFKDVDPTRYQEYSKWGDPSTLGQRLQAKIDQDLAAARKQWEAEVKKAAPTQPQTDNIDYDALTPSQLRALLKQELTKDVGETLNAQVQEYWKQAQQQLQGATGNTQQQFDLLARAIDAKLKNPSLDIGQVWKQMTELATATPDKLMELAMNALSQPVELEKKIAEARAQWEAEAKRREEAERLNVLNGDSLQTRFKRKEDAPSLNKDGEDALRNHILQKFLADGKLQPNQI